MTDPDRLVWDDMLAQLRAQHPKLCRQWFEGIEPVCITDGAMFVRAHNATHARYLRSEECVAAFNDAARTATNRLIGVRFLGPEDSAPEFPAAAISNAPGSFAQASAPAPTRPTDTTAGRRAHGNSDHAAQPERPRASWHGPDDRAAAPQSGPGMIQPALSHDKPRQSIAATEAVQPQTGGNISLAADFDFDSFVVGPSNRLAHAASQAVSENPGRAYNPLFIHGGVGLGKTHLLQAICGRVVDDNPRAMVHFDSCESFMNDFIESVQS
ncbi:MAG: DnaA/Hda family protein, partial [Planctomycetota bacterium]